jgi:hypothetical protein
MKITTGVPKIKCEVMTANMVIARWKGYRINAGTCIQNLDVFMGPFY